jgi:hypothetical protein
MPIVPLSGTISATSSVDDAGLSLDMGIGGAISAVSSVDAAGLSLTMGIQGVINAAATLEGDLDVKPSPAEETIPDVPREVFRTGKTLQDQVTMRLHGDPGANNELEISTKNKFKLKSGAPTFGFEAPPSTSPVKLGVLPGDRLQLFGSGYPNHLKVYTFDDPEDIEVLEEIEDYDTDTNQYEYDVIRRK